MLRGIVESPETVLERALAILVSFEPFRRPYGSATMVVYFNQKKGPVERFERAVASKYWFGGHLRFASRANSCLLFDIDYREEPASTKAEDIDGCCVATVHNMSMGSSLQCSNTFVLGRSCELCLEDSICDVS